MVDGNMSTVGTRPCPMKCYKKTEWRIGRDIEERGGSVAICGLGRVNIYIYIQYIIYICDNLSYQMQHTHIIEIHYTCIIIVVNNNK